MTTNKNQQKEFRYSIIKSFGCAFYGIFIFFKNDFHGKIHLLAAVFVIFSGFLFRISQHEWLFILLCISIVMGSEMMNHAIEKLCDKVNPEWDDKIKIIKDVSAGMVLICSIFAATTGLIIFIPRILKLLN